MGGVVVAPFPNALRYGWSEDEAADFCLRELDYILETYSAPADSAAVFIEPILGEGGFVPASTRYMAGLRERCDRHSMLLAVDEVQAGYGRTGKFWSHSHFDAHPDIVMTAKGLASGFPLSAFAASNETMARGWPGSQGGTYGGNAVACAAALATLDVFEEEGLTDNAATQGAHLKQKLDDLAARFECIADVRGRGLMTGVEIQTGGEGDGALAQRIKDACEAEGLLLLRCGPRKQVIRWLPPLVVDRNQIDDGLAIFERALTSAAA
jgi:4-aminobutyrate aminotransferase-like enzyme